MSSSILLTNYNTSWGPSNHLFLFLGNHMSVVHGTWITSCPSIAFSFDILYLIVIFLSAFISIWRHMRIMASQIAGKLTVSLNNLFRVTSKKTSKYRITGLCDGTPSVNNGFSSQRASNAERLSLSWRHHGIHLTHWCRVTHICVGKLTIIGSDNGLSPERRQAIIWTNAQIWLIGPLGTNFSDILIEIQAFSFKKTHFKMSSGKRRLFCLDLNVLKYSSGAFFVNEQEFSLPYTPTSR